MNEELERTKQAIKDLDCIVSVKEWTQIAKQYNFLSSISLRRLYNNMTFHDLCKQIRKNEIH